MSVDYSYDPLNRLDTAADNRLAAGANTTVYTYDAVGNLETATYPNGVKSAYAYNSLNRLTVLAATNNSALPVASYAYTLGDAGNRLAVTEHTGRTVSYTYDSLYRLTNESVTGDTQGLNGAVGYTYDPVGNRLARTSTLPGIAAQTFTYDANDRLTSDTYDPNGNTTGSQGTTYKFDFENRLAEVGDGSVRYTYDGDGNRVAKTIGGVTTRYLVDTNNHTGHAQVVEELQGGIVQRTYTYGHDLISQNQIVVGQWQANFYGSVRYLTDGAGAVTDTYDYDAFGGLIARTGVTPNEYLYAGERFDPETGLYHLRARYMNPASGRFHTADVYEGNSFDPVSLHKYLYAGADPVNKVDPSGMFSLSSAAITMGNIGTLVSISVPSLSTVLYVASAVGAGVYIARYIERKWRMYIVWTMEGGWDHYHNFIYARDAYGGGDWRYDVGIPGPRPKERVQEHPFTAFEGFIKKRRGDGLAGYRVPVGRMTDWQLVAWEYLVMGSSNDANSPNQTTYNYMLGLSNCTSWSLAAGFIARLVSTIPS